MRLALLMTILCWTFPALAQSSEQASEVAARFSRAIELQRQGSWTEAAAEYRALLAIAPGYAEAQANFGVVVSRLNK